MSTQYIHYDPNTEDILGWYFTAFHAPSEIPVTNVVEVSELELGTVLALGLTKYTLGTNTYHTKAEGIQPDLVFSHIDYNDYSIHYNVVDNGEHAARKLLQSTYEEVITLIANGQPVPAQISADRLAAQTLLDNSVLVQATTYTPI